MQSTQNGAVTDDTNLPLQKANRIRRLGAANITFDIIEISGCVLIDPIGIIAVEISCGPNSIIFGIGDTPRTVNSVSASAGLPGNRAQVTTRVDSNAGCRTALDVNCVSLPIGGPGLRTALSLGRLPGPIFRLLVARKFAFSATTP